MSICWQKIAQVAPLSAQCGDSRQHSQEAGAEDDSIRVRTGRRREKLMSLPHPFHYLTGPLAALAAFVGWTKKDGEGLSLPDPVVLRLTLQPKPWTARRPWPTRDTEGTWHSVPARSERTAFRAGAPHTTALLEVLNTESDRLGCIENYEQINTQLNAQSTKCSHV